MATTGITTSDATQEPVIDQLLRQFCPPLDSALMHALLLDLPSTPSYEDIELIKTTLKSLANDAEIQSTPDHDDSEDGTGLSTKTTTTTNTNTTSILAEDSSLSKSLEVWSLNGDESSTSQGTTPSNRSDSERSSYRPDDPLAFLSSVFPNESIELLQQHLEASSGDVEVVVDELLSSGLLREAQREESSTSTAPPALDSPVVSKQQRKRIKVAQRASATLSLTSTPHLIPHSPTLSAASAGSAPSSPIIAAQPIENRWASISSHASNLANLLHVPESRIVSTYHKSSSSLPLTLARLLHALTAERPFGSLSNEEGQGPIDLKDSLGTVLPHLTEERLEMLLCATEGDVADAMDLEATIQEIERSEGRLVWSEILQLDSFEPQLTTAGPSFSSTSSTTIPITMVPNPRRQAVVQRKERYTSSECTKLELEYLHKRNIALRSAATHFQKGGTGERGVAFYWAEESRELDAKRKVWAERKAVALVRERALKDGMGGGRGIDLHGLTMNEAMAVTRESLEEWWSSVNHGALSPPPLRIITGVGKHSTNKVAILLPAVIKLLDREGWNWSYDNGFGGAGARGAVLVKGRK
ncbi:BQ2448_7883 [Microbotryum intermedium]|uniref:BQ2448_7883 protein n=1 Tax=Microbotryum intermedium TaxID=269621 RepID=A0A238FSM7_9BASI|nr:BQ2448_7883 [Microbotryum intermedium]